MDTCDHIADPEGNARLCSMVTDYYSRGGDSGSPVFVMVGQNVKLVGINWGFDDENHTSAFSP